MFKYFPHTEKDIKTMLDKIGIGRIEDLFNDIPKDVLLDNLDEFELPNSMSEIELRKDVEKISKKNKSFEIYRGGGAYDVYTPSIIDYITSRQEFLTSYTPYQAEISQGTLKYIFEFQSLICELTGMDVSNASMYDGATSCAEALLMACSQTKRNKVLVSKTLNNNYLKCIETYMSFKGIEIEYLDYNEDLILNSQNIIEKLDKNVAGVIVSYPNYFGYLENNYNYVDKIKENKSLFIVCSEISTLGLLKSPKEIGADIVCGDCQALGISLSNGGPYLGYLACLDKYVRKMPGRIVGMTNDTNGKRGFVLTLQAREQHIRREKATSNICSNQSLMALHVTIYASLLGRKGLKETQERCYANSHYLQDKLLETKLFEKVSNCEFIKEFTLKSNINLQSLNNYLESKGYLGGIISSDNLYTLCATETKDKESIDDFVKIIGEYNE